MCRSRREPDSYSNEYLLAKFGFDTAAPRTSLVEFARSPCTDRPGRKARAEELREEMRAREEGSKPGPRPFDFITEVRTADETPPVILAEKGNGKAKGANGNGKTHEVMAYTRAKNCIILVHGFQGCSFDMRSVKNQLSLEFPETQFLLSTSNENNTDVAFEEMGARLANEVKSFFAEQVNSSAAWRLAMFF